MTRTGYRTQQDLFDDRPLLTRNPFWRSPREARSYYQAVMILQPWLRWSRNQPNPKAAEGMAALLESIHRLAKSLERD